jgi:hypothetical protein
MRLTILSALLLATTSGAALAQEASAPAEPAVPKPAALTAEQIPPLPLSLAAKARPYLESRGAGFAGWDPKTRAVLIATRFANTAQLHRVATPMGARTQITFEAEPVNGRLRSASG